VENFKTKADEDRLYKIFKIV